MYNRGEFAYLVSSIDGETNYNKDQFVEFVSSVDGPKFKKKYYIPDIGNLFTDGGFLEIKKKNNL